MAFGGQTKTGGLSQIHPYMGGGAPPGICRLRDGSGMFNVAPGPWILSFEGWVGNVARPKYGIFMYTLLNYIRILNRSAGCATHVACYEHIFYEQDDNARAGS